MHRGTESPTESLSYSGIMGVSEITSTETVRIHPPSTRSVARGANLLNTLLRRNLCLLRNADRFSTSSGMISPPAPSLVHYSAVTVEGTHSQTSARIILVLGISLQGRELRQ